MTKADLKKAHRNCYGGDTSYTVYWGRSYRIIKQYYYYLEDDDVSGCAILLYKQLPFASNMNESHA